MKHLIKYVVVWLLLIPGFLFSQSDPVLDSLKRPLLASASARAQADRLQKILWHIFIDGNLDYEDYPAQLDSLYRLALVNKTGDPVFEKRTAAYVSLFYGSALLYEQPDAAVPILQSAVQHFKTLNDAEGVALSYMELTYCASGLGDSLAFADYHDRAAEMLVQVKDPYINAVIHNNIGIGCYNFGRYAEAATHYFAALELVEKFHTPELLNMERDIYHNLNGIYRRLEDHETALIYIQKAVQSAEARGQNPSDHYTAMATNYVAMNAFDKALATYKKAEEGQPKGVASMVYAPIYYGMSNCYRNLGDVKSALLYAQKAIELLPIESNTHFGAVAVEELAASEFSAGMTQKALTHALLAYQTFLKAKNNGGLERTAELLSRIYKFKNDYRKALEYSELRYKYQNQIERQQSNRQLAFGEFTRDNAAKTARREAEVKAQLDQQRNIRYALFAGLAVLALLAILLYNRFRFKQKNAEQLQAKNLEVEAARSRAEQERRRAEASEAFKSRFLANMSHEIRTPLHGISGFTDLLLETSLSEKQRRWLSSIHHSTDRLGEVVNDILDLSKLEAGEVKLRQIPFSPARIAADVQEALSLRAENKGIELTLKVDENIPEAVLGDPTRLYQILMNLVGNAVKFTEKGIVELAVAVGSSSPSEAVAAGTIPGSGGLPTATANCQLKLTVTDTGIGIPPEKLAAVFDSFQQAGEDTTARFGGTGLGLTIARELVQLHGSDIKVESEVGKGSTFSFVLNLPLADAADLNQESIAASSLFFDHTLRILLADDNALNREIATEAIRRHFETAEIVEAANGKEAVERIQNGVFDLVLMDMQMPEMTGTEATRHIRQHISTELPIIALTASATPEEIESALQSGMNRHLGKPFKPRELAKVMAEVLDFSTSEAFKTLPTLGDLSFLRDFCEGDEEQMRHFIQKFLAHYPFEIKRLEDALAKEDREAIYQVAHSFRPQLEFVGLKEAAELSLQLEQKARTDYDLDNFSGLLSQLKQLLEDLPPAPNWIA